MSNKQWSSAFTCTPPALALRRFNKQQRMLINLRTEPNTAMPEEVQQQQKEKRKRETEKEMGREGDMIGRKARQRG